VSPRETRDVAHIEARVRALLNHCGVRRHSQALLIEFVRNSTAGPLATDPPSL
jgi:hypothetical protein